MYTDFKIVSQENNGAVWHVLVKFYEGDITTKDEYDFLQKKSFPITRYRRSGKVREETYRFDGKLTDDDIEAALLEELKKDASRIPVPEQDL